MLKSIIVVLTCLFIKVVSFAQIMEWSQTEGEDSYDITRVIEFGEEDYIYKAGEMGDFDSRDGYIEKFDTDGNLIWKKILTGSGRPLMQEIISDKDSSIYVSGFYVGTVDFDPGPDESIFTAESIYEEWDFFISKFDSDGNFIWVKTFTNISNQSKERMVIDSFGNIIIGGSFIHTTDFDPGLGVWNLIADGESTDNFILKLNLDGDFVWVKQFGNEESDFLGTLDVNALGEIYLTGRFYGTVDFDPSPTTYFVTANADWGNQDLFIQKLDNDGNNLWVKHCGAELNFIEALNLEVDEEGSLFIIGRFNGTIDFDPSDEELYLSPEGYFDGFIQKMNGDGELIWAKAYGTAALLHEISTDEMGYLYVTGRFSYSVDLDLSASVTTVTGGINDHFIQKLDTAGNFIWGRNCFIGATGASINGLLADGFGSIYCVGGYETSLELNFLPASETLVSSGPSDALFFKLSNCESDTLDDLISSCAPYTWVDGVTYSESTTATTHLINEIGCDSILVLDFTMHSGNEDTVSVISCGEYLWSTNDTTYFESGFYTDTLFTIHGCDSILWLDLTINDNYEIVESIITCDSLTWINGETYYENTEGVAHTLLTEDGCDSIINLDLIINYSVVYIDSIQACNSYTWIDGFEYTEDNYVATYLLSTESGCDSLVQLHLDVNHDSYVDDVQVACDSYTWIDDSTYTETTSSMFVMTTADGCDSIISLDLTIIDIDPTITAEGANIISNESDAIYQWVTCPEMTPIDGATEQSFTPAEDGEYAVIVSKLSCEVLSACFLVFYTSLNEHEEQKSARIYPNPSENNFNIALSEPTPSALITISNILGDIVFSKEYTNTELITIAESLPSGIYFVTINKDNVADTIKVLISETP